MTTHRQPTRRQIVRFAAVGLVSNGILFAFYLALTSAGLTPAMAMSLAYAAGVLQTFVFNRSWTFGHRGATGAPFARYVITYAMGYLGNLLLLLFLVDRMGLPHQWVQAVVILCVAIFVFTLQKHWVFRTPVEREAQ
jgi:putative flippase GtrA